MNFLFLALLCWGLVNHLEARIPTFPIEHWAIEIKDSANVTRIGAQHGFEVLHAVGSLKGVYLLRRQSILAQAYPELTENPDVIWAEKQVPLERHKREQISDPLYPNQWHLHGDASHINVVPVWNNNVTGSDVVIAVVDDGLQYDHPDIQPNYFATGSYDFNFNDPNPYPDGRDDTHGTSAAGVAGARDNNECGVGSAYRAKLAGIRILSGDTTDALEASALSYKINDNSIFSNSWGPVDDGKRLEGPGPILNRAMEQAISTGRDGKGTIYVWAAGNGKAAGDNCNYDGYANSRYTIAIGATDYLGNQAYYSENCAMLVVSAPSSGSGRSITTTAVKRNSGPSCRSDFGGTSSAAPLVSGVVALILEANPLLSWRDVQAILIQTATKNAPTDSDWKLNGAGLHVNHKYGFGLVNSNEAVNLARQWINFGEYVAIAVEISPNAAIVEGTPNIWSLQVSSKFTIEHVEIILNIDHPRRGELGIVVISPFGTESVLAEPRSDYASNINWKFGTIRTWGESSKGLWKLKITDSVTNGMSGTLKKCQLNIYGH